MYNSSSFLRFDIISGNCLNWLLGKRLINWIKKIYNINKNMFLLKKVFYFLNGYILISKKKNKNIYIYC